MPLNRRGIGDDIVEIEDDRVLESGSIVTVALMVRFPCSSRSMEGKNGLHAHETDIHWLFGNLEKPLGVGSCTRGGAGR